MTVNVGLEWFDVFMGKYLEMMMIYENEQQC
jgi:hypothetical protein